MKQNSGRTEQARPARARRDILFHKKRHPNDRGALEIQAFLSHLVTQRNVAASAQTILVSLPENPALSAVPFLYREVLHKDYRVPSK